MPILLSAAAIVFFINLPFGWLRAGQRRFAWRWLIAVHAPVPLVIGVRYLLGVGFQLFTYPILVGAYFMGQFLGGRLRALATRRP